MDRYAKPDRPRDAVEAGGKGLGEPMLVSGNAGQDGTEIATAQGTHVKPSSASAKWARTVIRLSDTFGATQDFRVPSRPRLKKMLQVR